MSARSRPDFNCKPALGAVIRESVNGCLELVSRAYAAVPGGSVARPRFLLRLRKEHGTATEIPARKVVRVLPSAPRQER